MRTSSKSIDLNLLTIFVTVYQTRSVTVAAEQLDMTQSAVSNALSRLKQHFDSVLFDRTGRGISPTRFADQLYAEISVNLSSIESSVQSFQNFDPSTYKAPFIVYCYETLITHFAKQTHHNQDYANIICKEPPWNLEDAFDDLSAGKADVLLDIQKPQSAMFQSKEIGHETLCCVVSKSHPRIQGELSSISFYEERHAKLRFRRKQQYFLESFIQRQDASRELHSEHGSILSMMATVAQSDAIGTVSERSANMFAEIFNLQVLPLPFERHSFPLYIVWHSRQSKNPANQWLRHAVESLLTN